MTPDQTTDSTELGEMASWPLHKVLMSLYKDSGPDEVTALLQHIAFSYEMLIDNAKELERRHFPHVAKLLWNAAKSARSQVDDILEKVPDYITVLGPDAVEDHKQQQLVIWTYQRLKETGESWNALVKHYGIEEWVGLQNKDFTLAPDNRVSFIGVKRRSQRALTVNFLPSRCLKSQSRLPLKASSTERISSKP